MDKRYQVFVSSTYADLKDERRAVIQTLIELGCIPAGMELFPATDQEQLAFIKQVIDDCDYYLLIIAGRYGSVSATGLSYTEQEFDYAVSRGLKVIAFVHENPDEIPLGKSEKNPASQEKLKLFREKVRTNRLVKPWKSAAELPGLVALNMPQFIRMHPAVGWVRADKVANEEVLSEINELRKQNDQFKQALTHFKPSPALENLAGLDEEIILRGKYYETYSGKYTDWDVKTTWRKIFGYISPYLVKHPTDGTVKEILAKALFTDASHSGGTQEALDDQDFQTVSIQLKAVGLVKIEYTKSTSGSMALFWWLTGAGERLMLELRTVRAKQPPAPAQA